MITGKDIKKQRLIIKKYRELYAKEKARGKDARPSALRNYKRYIEVETRNLRDMKTAMKNEAILKKHNKKHGRTYGEKVKTTPYSPSSPKKKPPSKLIKRLKKGGYVGAGIAVGGAAMYGLKKLKDRKSKTESLDIYLDYLQQE